MSEHTPGPWKIFDGWGSSQHDPIIVDSIPDVGGKCVANCICHISATNDDAAANARLIASAPDLLDALSEVIEWIAGWDPNFTLDREWPQTREKVRAAIAKAKGGEE